MFSYELQVVASQIDELGLSVLIKSCDRLGDATTCSSYENKGRGKFQVGWIKKNEEMRVKKNEEMRMKRNEEMRLKKNEDK